MQIHIYVFGTVHPELATCDYENGVGERGYMSWTANLAADDQRVGYFFEGESCEGFSSGGRKS